MAEYYGLSIFLYGLLFKTCMASSGTQRATFDDTEGYHLTFGDHILHRFRVRQASTRLMSHAYSIPSGHGNIAVEHIF